MKKRLLSLLVALCMAVTLLPVSALTAWAEGGGQLKIVDGYPVGSGKNHTVLHKRLTCILPARQNMIFPHFLVMETLWIALLKSGQRQQLQVALSPMI